MVVQIEASWGALLAEALEQPSFAQLVAFLKAERAAGKQLYPKGTEIFRAFELTPVASVRLVILGQDPYHGPGQAHGLAFSVPEGVPLPPSLLNIFTEIRSDTGLAPHPLGDLTRWAVQGVLLLNATLTVQAGEAGSHQRRGWEAFTDAAIQQLSAARHGLVFLLWGSYAQAKASLIDVSKHTVLRAPHPSPLSAYRGFFGCCHFSQANAALERRGYTAIDWR